MESQKKNDAKDLSAARCQLQRLESELKSAKLELLATSHGDAQHTDLKRTAEHPYIDPRLLRVLRNVDSKCKVTAAVDMSTKMNKWYQLMTGTCRSSDFLIVLRESLTLISNLLECDGARVYLVDKTRERLMPLANVVSSPFCFIR